MMWNWLLVVAFGCAIGFAGSPQPEGRRYLEVLAGGAALVAISLPLAWGSGVSSEEFLLLKETPLIATGVLMGYMLITASVVGGVRRVLWKRKE